MSHLQKLKAPRKKDQLGGLGPDFECDAYKAAAEKAARKKEFEARAKQIFLAQAKFNNRSELTHAQKKETKQQREIRER